MMELYLKRKFDAAHFLPGHPGKCKNLHGHTWVVEVWAEGEVDPDTGMVVDFGEIKEVIDFLDHTALNAILPEEFLPPTAENLVLYFLHCITSAYRVRVWESNDTFAEAWKVEEALQLQPIQNYFREVDYDATRL